MDASGRNSLRVDSDFLFRDDQADLNKISPAVKKTVYVDVERHAPLEVPAVVKSGNAGMRIALFVIQ